MEPPTMVGAPSSEGPLALTPGTILNGKYRIERELARGGMGAVVVATHLRLERQVAVKLLLPAGRDPAIAAARFLREAKAAAQLSGDHLVRIVDLDETADGVPFLVMELLDGVDLAQLVASGGALSPARAVDFGLQACAALAEAHACGIVHRDVKPANLFVVRRPDGAELVKLLDFGISKITADPVVLTKTSAALGSPLFMSPEQLLAPSGVDARTDVWALGVTLFWLLAGRPPFDAADASALAAQIAASPPRELRTEAPGVPEELAALVMRCLEKDPGRRPQTVVALAEALEPFRAPAGLGALQRVREASAVGAATRGRLARVEAPRPASASALTLSLDVPRASGVAPAPAAPSAGPASRTPSAERGTGPGAPADAAHPFASGAAAVPSGSASSVLASSVAASPLVTAEASPPGTARTSGASVVASPVMATQGAAPRRGVAIVATLGVAVLAALGLGRMLAPAPAPAASTSPGPDVSAMARTEPAPLPYVPPATPSPTVPAAAPATDAGPPGRARATTPADPRSPRDPSDLELK